MKSRLYFSHGIYGPVYGFEASKIKHAVFFYVAKPTWIFNIIYKFIDKIIVSTDSAKYKKIAEKFGISFSFCIFLALQPENS